MKMFKKKTSKLDLNPPKPPSKAEILEDLESFCAESILMQKSRRNSTLASTVAGLDASATGKDAEVHRDADVWWAKFEKFLIEVDELESYKKQFEVKKNHLEKLDGVIQTMSGNIRNQITDELQRALDEASDTGNDLK